MCKNIISRILMRQHYATNCYTVIGAKCTCMCMSECLVHNNRLWWWFSQDTECVYIMLSQYPISCASETSQVLSPGHFQQSLFNSQNFWFYLFSLFCSSILQECLLMNCVLFHLKIAIYTIMWGIECTYALKCSYTGIWPIQLHSKKTAARSKPSLIR